MMPLTRILSNFMNRIEVYQKGISIELAFDLLPGRNRIFLTLQAEGRNEEISFSCQVEGCIEEVRDLQRWLRYLSSVSLDGGVIWSRNKYEITQRAEEGEYETIEIATNKVDDLPSGDSKNRIIGILEVFQGISGYNYSTGRKEKGK